MSDPARPGPPGLPPPLPPGAAASAAAGARPRTMSRMRGEALPGMELPPEAIKTIGRYEIIKTLGRGAMGIVYKARDPLLDRTVAVKTIVSPQGVGRRVRAAYIERFQREAKAAAKMQHPAIVTIFDVGVDEEHGSPFMVLEYLPGESLGDRLDRVRIGLGRGVQIALDLASALSFAHRQRIVHRDVKPANVLHAGENRWKLADFGIARLPDSDLTQVGIFMGTPGYSPPEAIREGRYTAGADVFAWGAVLYEILSGRIPYEGPDTKTTNSYVVRGDVIPVIEHDPSIPRPIADVIMKALAGNANDRYRDATEAESALRDVWQRCLTEGLVHPSVLAIDELPHEKAPAQMHAAPGGARPRGEAGASREMFDAVTRVSAGGAPAGTDDEATRVVKRGDLSGGPPGATGSIPLLGSMASLPAVRPSDLSDGGLADQLEPTHGAIRGEGRRQVTHTGNQRTVLIAVIVGLVAAVLGAALVLLLK
jgi:hypothetical protein